MTALGFFCIVRLGDVAVRIGEVAVRLGEVAGVEEMKREEGLGDCLVAMELLSVSLHIQSGLLREIG